MLYGIILTQIEHFYSHYESRSIHSVMSKQQPERSSLKERVHHQIAIDLLLDLGSVSNPNPSKPILIPPLSSLIQSLYYWYCISTIASDGGLMKCCNLFQNRFGNVIRRVDAAFHPYWRAYRICFSFSCPIWPSPVENSFSRTIDMIHTVQRVNNTWRFLFFMIIVNTTYFSIHSNGWAKLSYKYIFMIFTLSKW